MAPKVQTLAQVMTDLNPAYAASQKVIQQQQSALPAKYDAQRAGINAQRGQGFNAINNQATSRGASFSGIPLDEQATYLSTQYLPGMQQANYQQNQEGLTLQGQAADLTKQQATQAYGAIQQQKQNLNSWNMQAAQQAAAAREAALQRQFTASENAMSRSASAASAAADRAFQAQQDKMTPYEAAVGYIHSATGNDGYVSPTTFNLARDAYVQAGGKAGDFASQFWKYTGANKGQANANNWKAYYYG